MASTHLAKVVTTFTKTPSHFLVDAGQRGAIAPPGYAGLSAPGIWLGAAILAEVFATSALKAAAGFTRPGPSAMAVMGYALAFYYLSQSLKTIPIGVAYAIWSGTGIVLITIVASVVYRQKLDLVALAGIGLIVTGAVVLQFRT